MPPITGLPALEAFMVALGKGYVFTTSDPETEDTWEPLGYTEGEIQVALNDEYNDLMFTEASGPGVYESHLQGENPVLTIPLVIGNATQWAKISPVNNAGGGYGHPQSVTPLSVMIAPESEIVASGLSYDGVAWAPNDPLMVFWAWRAYFRRPQVTYRQDDGGKTITPIEMQVMYDQTKTDGIRSYYIGNPVAAGYTALRV
jgi:hypothetical protein